MSNQCAKIIVEGTEHAKTKEIALSLSDNTRICGDTGYQRYTAVISSKWGYFDDFPWGKKLIDYDPAEEDQAMKNFGIWARLIELQNEYNWTLDRFHISTQQYQFQCNNNSCDFNWLEEGFLKLGFHLVHVTQNADFLKSTLANGSLEDIIREQEMIRHLIDRLFIPVLGVAL